jgi:hypothetical protein
MTSLDKDFLNQLLEEDAKAPKRGGGGRAKADPTADRTLTTWFKLPHHICSSDCPHRTDEANPTKPNGEGIGNACWNPNCVDPRDKNKDRAAQIVFAVKGKPICRYCYIDGYLLDA